MATNKDHIEKLELEFQNLKSGMQKLSTDSEVNFRELKEMFAKSLEKGESLGTKEKGFTTCREKTPPGIRMDPRDQMVSLS
jgi:hypothetical protein